MRERYPEIVISAEGVSWQKKGQMWLYRNNVLHVSEELQNGMPADVVGEDGEYLGTGLYSQKSHITVRILSRNRDEDIDTAFFIRRIREAYEFRRSVEPENLTNCRLIFGEADLLPGLLADRYNEFLVVQISTYGMEMRKDALYAGIMQVLQDAGEDVKYIYEKNDIAVREKEGLTRYEGWYTQTDVPAETVIDENGLKIRVDIAGGQKTGYFLDQKSNRVLVRHLAKNKRVLDCFTHTGGFALNAAYGGAADVTAVDVSAGALAKAAENAELNGLSGRMHFVQADVFAYLETCTQGQYDLIILDPPAFTKSRRTVDHAYQGYKTINKRAMELLKNYGYLATCSCSRFMETENFERMLREAASEAGVYLQQISVTQQNGDHPILWTMAETSYLKFYLFRIIPVK